MTESTYVGDSFLNQQAFDPHFAFRGYYRVSVLNKRYNARGGRHFENRFSAG